MDHQKGVLYEGAVNLVSYKTLIKSRVFSHQKKNYIAMRLQNIQGIPILSVNIFRGDRRPIGEHCLL